MSEYPTNELVAVAWLGQRVPGFTPDMIGTSLPRDVDKWLVDGFVQVTAIASTPDIDVPLRRPTLQVDLWATSPKTSAKIPWNRANRLAELLRVATETGTQVHGRPVTLPDGYNGARVQSVYLLTEPSRMPGDPSGYARYSLDLALDWVPL
jgi:hypothetical protein